MGKCVSCAQVSKSEEETANEIVNRGRKDKHNAVHTMTKTLSEGKFNDNNNDNDKEEEEEVIDSKPVLCFQTTELSLSINSRELVSPAYKTSCSDAEISVEISSRQSSIGETMAPTPDANIENANESALDLDGGKSTNCPDPEIEWWSIFIFMEYMLHTLCDYKIEMKWNPN